jgi:hypothetical protein
MKGVNRMMGKKLVMSALASMVVVAGVQAAGVVQATAAPPSGITCAGTVSPFDPMAIPGGTYGSLSMPPGSLCLIEGAAVIVNHPVTLGSGSGLGVLAGSLTVNGPVTAGHGAAFGDFNSTAPITVNGPVSVDSNGALVIGSETPYGPLLSSIAGPVRATDPSTVQIHNTAIGGPVILQGGGGANPVLDAAGLPFGPPFGYNFNDLEDNVISGPVSETGYDGIWSGVLRNVMGPLTFSNNSEAPAIDEYDIGSNRINGPATCSGNDPAPNMGQSAGAPSIVSGPTRGDQAATCTGVAGGVSGPPV